MVKLLALLITLSLALGSQAQQSPRAQPPTPGQFYPMPIGSVPVTQGYDQGLPLFGPGQAAAAYNTLSMVISPTCPDNSTSCVKVYADGLMSTDATSNSTTTLACPDCNFTQADVGKVEWATTQGLTGGFIGRFLDTTFVCPYGKILSVVSPTTVTLSNACTASGSGNVVFYWGHDDGPTLALMRYGCNVMHVSTAGNMIFTSQPFAYTDQCNHPFQPVIGAPGAALIGDGFDASQAVFMLTPNYNFGTGQFIGRSMRALANLQILGSGLEASSNPNCANGNNTVIIGANGASSVVFGVDVAGICPGAPGMVGMFLQNDDEVYSEAGVQSVGQYACEAYLGQDIHLQANDCTNQNIPGGLGLRIVQATVLGYGNIPLTAISVDGTSIFTDVGSNIYDGNGVPSIQIASGGQVVLYNPESLGVINNAGNLVLHDAPVGGQYLNASTGTMTFSNSIIPNTDNAGKIVSLGGNKLVYGPVTEFGASWTGAGILFGSCRGTATSSSTLGLYGFGQFATPNCTSTTVAAGIAVPQVPISGSVLGLNCYATHAGVNGSSGVITVLKNGSPTALTCTLGTGTNCHDNNHYDIPVIGDVYSIQFTTQPSEVLAGVSCTLVDW